MVNLTRAHWRILEDRPGLVRQCAVAALLEDAYMYRSALEEATGKVYRIEKITKHDISGRL